MDGEQGFQDGHEKLGGRKKGTPDKFNGTVKEAVLEVFQKLGGVEGLYLWAAESASNKRIFYTAFMKMLPREVHIANGDSPEDLPFRIAIEKGDDDSSQS